MISSFEPIVGGAEKATQTLAKGLRERDYDVVVLTRRYSRRFARTDRVSGIPVYRLGWPGRGKLSALTFGLHALALLAWRLRHWRVIHIQNIDTPLLVGLVARTLPGRRLVATIHGQTQIQGRNRSWRGRIRTGLMARRVDRFTSINPENTRALRRLGVPRSRIREIPNGIDTRVFRPPTTAERAAARATLGLEDHEFVVVYIGRLVPWKRVDLLIRAWTELEVRERRRLLIVGDGPDAEALRAMGAPAGEKLRFDGVSTHPVTHLWAADVFANASGDNLSQGEGLSVALLEAMAAGVPPVVTQGPGNDVVVEDGVTGLSFPVQDVAALVRCLRALHRDPALRRRLGDAAHERVAQRFSIEAVVSQLEALYRSLEGER